MGGRPGAGARLRELAILTGAMAVISAAVFFFLVPSRAAVSSIAGAAIIINGVVDLPVSLITLILNGALIALGLAVFGGGFAFNTIYTCALLSAFMAALERLFPDFSSLTGSPELDVICYVLVVSWAFHAVKDTQPALIGIAAHEVVLMRCYAFSCSVYSFQALTCASSQLHQASTPSPVLALIGNISISGLRLCANSRTLSMLKSK